MKIIYLRRFLILSLAILLAFSSMPVALTAFANTVENEAEETNVSNETEENNASNENEENNEGDSESFEENPSDESEGASNENPDGSENGNMEDEAEELNLQSQNIEVLEIQALPEAPNSQLDDSTGQVYVLHYDVSSLPNTSGKSEWLDALSLNPLPLVIKSGKHGNDNWTPLDRFDAFLTGNMSGTQKNAQQIYGFITPDEDVDQVRIATDDGLRLKIDLDQSKSFESSDLLINSWTTQSSTTHTSPNALNLKAGFSYSFHIDYFNWGGFGNLNFEVKVGDQWKVIPSHWFSTDYINKTPEIITDDISLYTSDVPWDVMTDVLATDFEDGDLTSNVIVKDIDGNVIITFDISEAGTYSLTYSVTDAHNATTEVERIVTVNEAPKVDNLFITVDDYYNIWFNGQHIGNGAIGPVDNLGSGDGDKNWKTVDAYSVTIEDENLIAVKGWDRAEGTATISGFIAKLVLDENQSETTDSTWMYTLTEPTIYDDKNWYDPDYTGGDWLPVTVIDNSYYLQRWTSVSDYSLLGGANWIWSDLFVGSQFDSPVWFRNIVKYKVTFAAGERGTFDDQISIVQKDGSTPQAPVVSGQAGYSFAGWSPEIAESVTESVVYTAQWTANENTLTYNGNGNTLGQAPDPQNFTTGQNITVVGQGDLEKEGYEFSGWNTQADGSGTPYSPESLITGTDNIELFAQWTPKENTLTYNGNESTSGQVPPSQIFLSDDNVLVASEGDLEKEGYLFDGWNTKADGSGSSYRPNASITGTGDIELFAQWTLDPYVIITDTEGAEIGSEGLTLYIGTAYNTSQGQSQLQTNIVADQQIIETTWEIISGSDHITLTSNGLVEGILATGGTPAVVRVNVVLSDESVISDEVNVIVIRGDLPVNPPVDPPTQPPVDPPAPTVSISLDRNPVELEYGSEALEEFLSYDLTETITGSSDPNVEWTIENPEIATVDQNGLVTAVEQGETTVTVRHIASGATASSTVIVFLVGEEENPLGAVQFFDPYIIGYPDQTFGPQRSVTRAEVATMFARILNLNLDFPGSPRFNDVSESTWYYKYIQASTRAGLFGGYSDGSFKPDAPITRGEIATVFSKYWDFLDIRVNALPTNALVDVDGSHWASEYIYKMYNTGIVKGFEDGSYRPNSNTLREQVVGMINTLIARPEYLPENTKYVDITKNHWAFGNIEAATTPYSAQTNLPIDVEN